MGRFKAIYHLETPITVEFPRGVLCHTWGHKYTTKIKREVTCTKFFNAIRKQNMPPKGGAEG